MPPMLQDLINCLSQFSQPDAFQGYWTHIVAIENHQSLVPHPWRIPHRHFYSWSVLIPLILWLSYTFICLITFSPFSNKAQFKLIRVSDLYIIKRIIDIFSSFIPILLSPRFHSYTSCIHPLTTKLLQIPSRSSSVLWYFLQAEF